MIHIDNTLKLSRVLQKCLSNLYFRKKIKNVFVSGREKQK